MQKTETYLTMGAISQLVSALVAGSITTPSLVITATSNWNQKKSNLASLSIYRGYPAKSRQPTVL